MKLVFLCTLLSLMTVGNCKPRFIAVPLDDVQMLQMFEYGNHQSKNPGNIALTRLPRKASEENLPSPSSTFNRHERQAHDHHDYVDFGAHTGHHGSFGWYADFPAYKDN